MSKIGKLVIMFEREMTRELKTKGKGKPSIGLRRNVY